VTFCSYILCAKLAHAIHGTDEAIRYTSHQCRDLVSREYRPLLSRLMRHPKIGVWLNGFDDV
jgi:hypothetical protein